LDRAAINDKVRGSLMNLSTALDLPAGRLSIQTTCIILLSIYAVINMHPRPNGFPALLLLLSHSHERQWRGLRGSPSQDQEPGGGEMIISILLPEMFEMRSFGIILT